MFKAQSSSKKIRVLFLGNSYTYVNNLPLLIANVAHAGGDSLFYDSNCIGGYSFYDHVNDASSLAKISAGNWDAVVLQAQSQEPSFSPAQVNAQTLPYAIQLDSVIKHYNPCALTVFYETWGRKTGDASNCPFYPPVCTYSGMQNRLRASYKLFADTVKGCMAPVGEAFRKLMSLNSQIDLYQADLSHPSLEGSYLAASVFYESLFAHSVITNSYNPGVSGGTLTLLQQVAHSLVNDSITTWNFNKHQPKAIISYTAQSTSSFQFQFNSAYFLTTWYFGDGTSSSLVNPLHYYQNPGTYTISLVVYDLNQCRKDSISTTLTVSSVTALKDKDQVPVFSIYPNPCKNELFIKNFGAENNNEGSIHVYDALGRLLIRLALTDRIDLSGLQNGPYFIKVSHKLTEYNSCFIKNEW